MNSSTAARFAQLLAAATPAAALPAPPPEAPKVQPVAIVPAVIPPAATAPKLPEFTPPAPQQAEPEPTKEAAEIDLMPEYVSALFDKFKEGYTVKYVGAQATATIESFEYEHTLPTAKIVWNDTGKRALAYLDSLEVVETPKKARCIPMQFTFTTPTTTGIKGKKLSIETYTDKSFVVRGEETKKYSDQLFKLAGKYNHHLKGGPGWIFSNKHLKDVQKFVG